MLCVGLEKNKLIDTSLSPSLSLYYRAAAKFDDYSVIVYSFMGYMEGDAEIVCKKQGSANTK